MAKSRKVFAIHPGDILKTEFMEPMNVSAYALAKALNFPGIYEVIRGERAISADTAVRLGKYFDLPAQFWLNLQNDYDLRIAVGSGIGKGIRPRKIGMRRPTCRHPLEHPVPTHSPDPHGMAAAISQESELRPPNHSSSGGPRPRESRSPSRLSQ